MRRPALRSRSGLLPTIALVAAGCGEAAPPAISVGPVAFSEDELAGLTDARREMLAYLAAFGLAVADSSTGALGAPLVEDRENDVLLDILAAELTLERNGIEDDALEAHYLTDPQWELVVRHILFFSERWRSSDHRAAAEEKAGRALEALRAGADFAETAAALSEEPGAEGRQGLLTPGREGSWVPEFWAAALALQPGEISPVTETQYGYHILRLEDRRVVPFAEARSVVARRVAEQVGDPAAVLDGWMGEQMTGEAAAREAALSEANGRDLTVPGPERDAILRAWEDTVLRWATTLGFVAGADAEGVARAAAAALAMPAQGARLARDEILAHRGLLDARYDVVVR